MAKVKSAFEKAMERAAEIGKLTAEEKERLKSEGRLRNILSEFYKGQLDRDGLWQRLKGENPSFLKEAQLNLIDSLGLGTTTEEFRQRKDGILAIETLKEKQNTSAIEHILDSIKMLQKEYEEGKEKTAEELRRAIEENPQLRVQPVKTPDGRTVFQAALSVDEAVQSRLSEFLSRHEEQYSTAFGKLIAKLKKEIK